MASNRIQRTNEDIRLALSELLRSVKDPRVNQGMISVTSVNVTGDLRWCKVYLSVYGLKSEKEFMKGLKSASGWLRHEIGARLSLRNVPELVFELDHSIEHGAHINELISELHIPEETDENDGE
jgi:ribosome-binding factor A